MKCTALIKEVRLPLQFFLKQNFWQFDVQDNTGVCVCVYIIPRKKNDVSHFLREAAVAAPHFGRRHKAVQVHVHS